ncbi:Cold-inducible RNA-binding protein [Gracilaria domingensis]|nr:Cold-inducible RNA-binding protein [Gracilaria domingensis]
MVEGESSLDTDTQVAEETKLFVGNLSWGVTDESLCEAFSEFGTVIDSRVIVDRFTGKSRGFGFIEYDAPDSAAKALTEMNGVEIDGRAVRVDRATRRTSRQRPREELY